MSRRRRQRQRRMAYINFAIIALLIAGGVAAFQFNIIITQTLAFWIERASGAKIFGILHSKSSIL